MTHFWRNIESHKICLLMTSVDLNIDLSLNINRNTSVMISDELSNAFFGFSPRRLGTKLEGEGMFKYSQHVVENPDSQQCAG